MKKIYLLVAIITTTIIIGVGCGNITITRTPTQKSIQKEVTQPIAKTTETTTEQKEVTQPIAKTTETATEQIEQKSTNPPTPVETNKTTVDCKNDLNCFAKRAATCEKTKFLFIKPIENPETPGIFTTLNINYEITGSTDQLCHFNESTGVFQLEVTESGIENLMAQEGKTREEIEIEIEQTNAMFRQDSDLEIKTYCQTSEGKNITEHIQKMLTGQSSLYQIGDKLTYEGNINCIQK